MTMQDDSNLMRGAPRSRGLWARHLTVFLGGWLFISAFLWTHSVAGRQNSWIVGLVMFVAGITALSIPGARWVNTFLSLWLIFATLTLTGASAFTAWHDSLLAIAVFLLSLVPSEKMRLPTPRAPGRV